VLLDAGKLEEALIELENARAINERWAQAPAANLSAFPTDLGRHFNNPQGVRLDLAGNNRQIGLLHYRQGRNQEAVRANERAREIFEALARENPDDMEFPSHLADILVQLAFIHGVQGRPSEALALLHRALEIMEPLAGKNPDVRNFQRQLAHVHKELGRQMRRLQQYSDARRHLEKALSVQERLAQSDPSNQGSASPPATLYRELGWVDRAEGQAAAALRWFEKARAIDERNAATYHAANYDLACDWAICIPLIGWAKRDDALTPAERAERQRLGDEAIKALRRAIDGGWRNVAHMNKDEDLDSLRERDDFKKLIAELSSTAGKQP
jgi:tetratricopeptide (TPR) repeat protein